MIRAIDRKIVIALVYCRIWHVERGLFGTAQIRTRKGTRWLYEWMKRRQSKEDHPYHHAPACPANRWSGAALVFQQCNCGAVKHHIVSRGYAQ